FDRCQALKSLNFGDCRDPNVRSDEFTSPPAVDFDASVRQPDYNPKDAAKLMETAGYHLVNGIRMFRDGKTPLELTIVSPNPAYTFNAFATKMQQAYETNLQIKVNTKIVNNLFDPYSKGGLLGRVGKLETENDGSQQNGSQVGGRTLVI